MSSGSPARLARSVESISSSGGPSSLTASVAWRWRAVDSTRRSANARAALITRAYFDCLTDEEIAAAPMALSSSFTESTIRLQVGLEIPCGGECFGCDRRARQAICHRLPGGAVNVRAEARSHERFPNRSPEALAHRIPTEDRDRRSGQSSSDLSDHYLFGSWPVCAGRTNCRNTELSGRHVLGSVVPWLTLGCSSN